MFRNVRERSSNVPPGKLWTTVLVYSKSSIKNLFIFLRVFVYKNIYQKTSIYNFNCLGLFLYTRFLGIFFWIKKSIPKTEYRGSQSIYMRRQNILVSRYILISKIYKKQILESKDKKIWMRKCGFSIIKEVYTCFPVLCSSK